MARNLAVILKADMPRFPLKKEAEKLRKKGRGNDTILAHITPREAAKLKREGGSGTINPETGLPEFDDGFGGMDFSLPAEVSGAVDAGMAPTVNVGPSGGGAQAPEFTGYAGGNQPVTQTAIPVSSMDAGDPYGGNWTVRPDVIAPGASTAEGGAGFAPAEQFWAQSYGAAPAQANITPAQAVTPDASGAQQQDQSLTPTEQKIVDTGIGGAPQQGGFMSKLGGQIAGDPLKALIAGLGVGGTGLSYMLAQNQAKSNAAKLAAAYNQAASQTQQLAQPFMQQGGQQLSQAITGQLSPAQLQQLQAAQAQTAQNVASAGGVGAAQAERSLEDLRQRLLSSQQQLALSLLGAGTPLVSQAIQQQLQGTTQGLALNQQLSQQAGQAATGVMQMLASLYGRSGASQGA